MYVGAYKGPLYPLKTSFDRSGGEGPDYALYEAETFCKLLQKGNPKVVEPFYSTHFTWFSPLWSELAPARGVVICATVARQYLGFGSRCTFSGPVCGCSVAVAAYAEVKIVRTGAVEIIAKPAYHAIRLIMGAENILAGRPPQGTQLFARNPSLR